jgi:hypothetical protein
MPKVNPQSTDGIEITWDEAAAIIGISARRLRPVVALYPKLCTPIVYGHRTVRLPLSGVIAVKNQRRKDALKKGVRK